VQTIEIEMADTPMYDEAATERHFTALEALFDRAL
jgi:hypothetical protein